MPSSAPQAPAGDVHARVLHEDLTFVCHQKACRVTASYLIEVDRAAQLALDFVLPVNAPVGAKIGRPGRSGRSGGSGGVATPVSVTSAVSAARDIQRRRRAIDLDLKGRYYLPDAAVLPPEYQARAVVEFIAGHNQVTFEYDQPLAALEEDRGYFHDGRMVPDFIYLLGPLKEWSRAGDFSIALRIEVDRVPPSWWKRVFGHPLNVACEDIRGQRAQVGGQLVYTAKFGGIGEPFPDYLHCRIGDDDLVRESP